MTMHTFVRLCPIRLLWTLLFFFFIHRPDPFEYRLGQFWTLFDLPVARDTSKAYLLKISEQLWRAVIPPSLVPMCKTEEPYTCTPGKPYLTPLYASLREINLEPLPDL